MPLPEQFNEWEFLQDIVRKTENKKILNFFSDLGGDDWDIDISTNRGSLRHACTHKDDDTAQMTLLRMWLFYFGMLSTGPSQMEKEIYYGLPAATVHREWRFTPQVKLYFSEDLDDVEPGYSRVEGEIGYRLVDETNTSITRAKAAQIGTRIEQKFNLSGGYRWHKGWNKCTYEDVERGYDFRLLVFDKPEAERIISDVLDLNNDTRNSALVNYIERDNPAAAFPTDPGNQIILGESRKKPRQRPRAYVRFRYAHLFIQGLPEPLLIASNIPGIPANVV